MKKCVFAGTFDPFTVGHEDTVRKCLALFDEVVVAVMLAAIALTISFLIFSMQICCAISKVALSAENIK